MFLARQAPRVLEEQHFAVFQRTRGRDRRIGVSFGAEMHRLIQEFREVPRDRCQGILWVDLGLGASEVREEHHAGSAGEQQLDTRDRRTNAGIVSDALAVEGDVEVDAYEGTAPPELIAPEVADGALGHGSGGGKGLESRAEELNEIHAAASVAPLVVVPAGHLHHRPIDDIRALAVDDG